MKPLKPPHEQRAAQHPFALRCSSAPILLLGVFLFACDGGEVLPKRDLPGAGQQELGELDPGVRQAAHAGRWYSDRPEALRESIRKYVTGARRGQLPEPRMLVCPHAGFGFSGPTAGWCYRQLVGRDVDRVWVLAPAHRSKFEGVRVPSGRAFATPLGEVPLDATLLAELVRDEDARYDDDAHAPEHTIELQLPFLQQSLAPGFRLVPLLVGTLGPEACEDLGKRLAQRLGARDLVVLSSDFTHYGRVFRYQPFTQNVAASIEALDRGAYELLSKLSSREWSEHVQQHGLSICGWRSIAIGLAMLGEGAKSELLHYQISGLMDDNWEQSVSYMAIAFSGRWRSPPSSAE